MHTTPPSQPREAWATRMGFILAAVGSAVGLGNMWRFSYVAAEGGGAAFLLLYILFVAFIGIPLITSEFVVGRLSHTSPIVAIKKLGGAAWAPLGILFLVCSFGILSYYSVVAGWTMRYAFDALLNQLPADTGGYFAQISSGLPAILMHLLFMGITVLIVIGGVKRGLERTALILMPLLFMLLLGLALWAMTLSGGGAGYAYYLKPQLNELLNPRIISLAAGQAFFSLSLGMGSLMTYASYLHSDANLGREATTVALADFGVAFVAGLIVFPIIFHFDLTATIGLGSGGVQDNTFGTLFITIVAGLQGLEGIGHWIIVAFFVMLFFASLTSSISMLEVAVAAFIDLRQWSRTRAAITLGAFVAVLGLPYTFNLNLMNLADKFIGSFLLVVGGFFTCLLVGYRLLPQAETELARGLPNANARKAWTVFIRYVAPAVLVVVIVFSLLDVVGAVRILFGLPQ